MCYDDEWYRYLWVAIVGLVLYAIGIPAGVFALLVTARKNHLELLLQAKREARKKHIDFMHDAVSRRSIMGEGGAVVPAGSSRSGGGGAGVGSLWSKSLSPALKTGNSLRDLFSPLSRSGNANAFAAAASLGPSKGASRTSPPTSPAMDGGTAFGLGSHYNASRPKQPTSSAIMDVAALARIPEESGEQDDVTGDVDVSGPLLSTGIGAMAPVGSMQLSGGSAGSGGQWSSHADAMAGNIVTDGNGVGEGDVRDTSSELPSDSSTKQLVSLREDVSGDATSAEITVKTEANALSEGKVDNGLTPRANGAASAATDGKDEGSHQEQKQEQQ